MQRAREELEKNFCCPKCRGRGAVVQDVMLGRSVARMIPLAPAQYLAASCLLCGYTELYLTSRVARQSEEAPAAVQTPAE